MIQSITLLRFPQLSPRTLLAAMGLALAGAFGLWLIDQALHVRSNDARVRADMVTISADMPGRLIERPVRPGDVVDEGAVLARLDAREAELALDTLTLRFEALESDAQGQTLRTRMLNAAGDSRISARRSDVAAARARLAEAESALTEANAHHHRIALLHQRGLSPDAALEQSAAQRDLAAHAATRAQREMEASYSGVHEARALSAETDIAARAADAAGIEARALQKQIALQQLLVTRHTLTSPLAGVIDDVFAKPGERIEPGQRIALLHNPSASWVEANIREADIARVLTGARVRVEFDSLPGRSFKGHVTRIRDAAASEFALLPVVNPTGVFTRVSQRVPVSIALDDPHPPLRPGALARVRIRANDDGR